MKPDDVVNRGAWAPEPDAFATAGPTVLRAREEETERVIAHEAERGVLDPAAVRRANAARVEAEQVRSAGQTDGDRRAAAQAEADRAAAQTGTADEPADGEEPSRQEAASTAPPGPGTDPAPSDPAPNGATANGRRAALGAGASTSTPADPRSDVLRWFDEAFAGLRRELREVVTGMSRQQAMLAEVMEARQADLRLVVVAEGLPDVVQDAVEGAVADSTRELRETFETALGELRQSVRNTETASAEAVAELRRALEASERSTAAALETSERSTAAALEASQRSATAALETSRRLQEEAEQREALRSRALKAAFTKQLKPLAEAAQQAAESSDRRMDEIVALLDAMAEAEVRPARQTAKKAATKKRAPAGKTAKKTATKAAKKAAPARKAAPSRRVLAPAQPTPLAAARRQPLRGLRSLEERG